MSANDAKLAGLNSLGKTYDFGINEGTVGPSVIDVSSLYAQTGQFTYDPGFTSTASCQSSITYIDGEEGILLHRGYPIGQLAENSSFMEVAYLLLNGELPQQTELDDFTYTITRHTMLHDQLRQFYQGFRRDAHPMAIMCGVVGALSAFYHDSTDISDPEQRKIASHRLIAKMPTIAAMAYKYSIGQPFVYPRNDLDYASNFLHIAFPCHAGNECQPDAGARHGSHFHSSCRPWRNASTSTVRLAGSSGANPFACIAAGMRAVGAVAAGTNDAEMLSEIGSVDNIPERETRQKIRSV